MKNIIVIAALTTFAAASSAFAADAVDATPAPPEAAAAQPVFTWAGGYGGIQGGGSWVKAKISEDDFSESARFNGGLVGGFAGLNFLQGNVVYGLEGDIGYTWNEKKNLFDVEGASAGTDLVGSVRGRVGYAIDRALIYGTAGWGVTRAYAEFDGDKARKTFNGWTLGAGVDYAFMNNVFGRMEYRYTDYGSKDFEGTKLDLNQNAVTVGVGYKF